MRLLGPARELARTAYTAALLARVELTTGREFRNLRLMARGFLSIKGALYPFDRFHPDLFLTDWEAERWLGRINSKEAAQPLRNKLFFHYVLEAAGLRHRAAPLMGTLVDGEFFPHVGVGRIETLLQDGALFVKPVSGRGGQAVRMVTRAEELPRVGTFVVERRVEQHEYASRIFPRSLNTLRVMMMKDGEGVFLAGVAHRFGVERSAPADNFHQGGVVATVARESHRLTKAASVPGAYATGRHAVHPETGSQIEGVEVPYFDEVLSLAHELTALFPGILMVGWDICITSEGPLVIEGNAGTVNPRLVQAHEPLLRDERVFRFLERHHVVTRSHAARVRRLRASV